MRRFLSAVLSAVAAGAFAVAVSAPASAAPPWTISPGGAVVGQATNPTLVDTARNVQLRCASSTIRGTLDVGSSADNSLGSISQLAFNTCTVAGLFPFTVTPLGLPWIINADPATSTAAVIRGRITGIRAQLSGTGCSAIIAGASATTPGYVTYEYYPSTGRLIITGGNLRIWNVSGCGGLLVSGDPVTFQASYTVTPRQIIIP
jgi:hypothetical protein